MFDTIRRSADARSIEERQMSTYEEDSAVDAARIDTVARARRLWRRTGKTTDYRDDADFFKDETPEAVSD
jgi:hypothetical protein